jgi:hypothetical protein
MGRTFTATAVASLTPSGWSGLAIQRIAPAGIADKHPEVAVKEQQDVAINT